MSQSQAFSRTDDVRIRSISELLPPIAHLYELPISEAAADLVETTRHQIADLVHGRDKRLLVIIGPCSIHDPKAAFEYAQRLLPLRKKPPKLPLLHRKRRNSAVLPMQSTT